MCVSISKYNFKIFKLDFFAGKIGNCRPKQKKKILGGNSFFFPLKTPKMYFEK